MYTKSINARTSAAIINARVIAEHECIHHTGGPAQKQCITSYKVYVLYYIYVVISTHLYILYTIYKLHCVHVSVTPMLHRCAFNGTRKHDEGANNQGTRTRRMDTRKQMLALL